MSRFVIEVESLSKQYPLNSTFQGSQVLAEQLTKMFSISGRPKSNIDRDHFYALKDVSFQIRESQVVGIIGGNGCGKSTLLKILSRITNPSSGRAVLRGRVSSMIELNVGFHPELTGRDNIYLLGTILGLRRREIDAAFDEIVEFSEIGKFLNTAVKYYSSGMFLRLGFAVAAHLRPEILLVDEVLAVGDAAFQHKCLTRMQKIAREGRTVLLVSHQLDVVRQLCDECVVLDKGNVIFFGKSEEAIAQYVRNVGLADDASSFETAPDDNMPLQITRAELVDELRQKRRVFQFGEPVALAIEYYAHQRCSDLYLELTINHNGETLFRSWDVDCEPDLLRAREVGKYRVAVSLPPMFLKPGAYTVGFAIKSTTSGKIVQSLDHVLSFEVQFASGDISLVSYGQPGGSIAAPLQWLCQEESAKKTIVQESRSRLE